MTTTTSSSSSTTSSTTSTTSSTSSTLSTLSTTSTSSSTSSSTTTSSTTTTLPPLTGTRKRDWKVYLNGINVDAFRIDGRIEKTFGNAIPIVELNFTQNLTGLITLGTDVTLVILEAFPDAQYKRIFFGYVESFKPDGAKIKIIGRNKLANTIRDEVTHVYDKTIASDPCYPSGKLNLVAKDILVNYCDLNADDTTIQDSGTDIVLSNKFVCNHADPLERLKKLQETLDWILYYDDDTDYVYFEPKSFETNATVLEVGTNIVGIPKWEETKDQMINDLTLEGAVMSEPRSEVKTGDASKVTFQLTDTNIPTHFEVYYNASKNYATASYTQDEHQDGVPIGTAAGTFNYTFDLENRSITFTSFTPATSTNNILIKYWIETPNPIHRVENTSIGKYGKYKKTITLSDVTSVEDAEKRSQTIIEKFSQPFTNGKFEAIVSDNTWREGQRVRVIDSVSSPTVDKYFTIIKHIKKYPGNIDEFVVGEKQWDLNEYLVNSLERLKRLEESQTGDTTIVNELIDNIVSFGIVPDYQVLTEERINDSFILGVSPYNILYDADEAMTLNNFGDATQWSDTGITTAKSTMDSTQGTSGDYLTGTSAIQFVGTVSGSFGLKTTASLGDLSSAVGTTSGTPSQGTFGVWLNTTQTSNFTSTVQLQIGPNASNYFVYNSQTYAQKVAADTTTWNLDSGWNLLLFDANTPASKTGTVTWTNSAYAELKGTVSGATTWSNDYFTVSKNDTISKCGLGTRFTTAQTLTSTF